MSFKKNSKWIAGSVLVLSAAALFADPVEEPNYEVQDSCCMVECFQDPCNFFWDLWSTLSNAHYHIYGDVLYWQAHEKGLPVAVDNFGGTVLDDGRVKNMKFNWDVGFRLGFNIQPWCDYWDIDLAWTRFYTSAHRRPNTNNTSQLFYPSQTHPADAYYSLGNLVNNPMAFPGLAFYINQGTNNSYADANAHVSIHMNQIDFDIGRLFYPVCELGLRPHFGVRTTWINQHFRVNYRGQNAFAQVFQLLPITNPASNPLLFSTSQFQNIGDEFNVRKTSNWWGIGPEIGLNTIWALPCDFELFGNATFAIEYGIHKTFDRDDDITLGIENVHVKNVFHASEPILDLQLGFGWGRDFCCGYNMNLAVVWEEHVYFSQNQFPVFLDSKSIGSLITSDNDLSYHGVTFHFDFGF